MTGDKADRRLCDPTQNVPLRAHLSIIGYGDERGEGRLMAEPQRGVIVRCAVSEVDGSGMRWDQPSENLGRILQIRTSVLTGGLRQLRFPPWAH